MKAFRISLFLFCLSFITQTYSQNVYTTKTGEKYHKSTCHYLKNSKKEITMARALELGYDACSVCKPTSSNTSKTVSKFSSSNTTQSQAKSATSTQCTGKTQSGSRCKRMTKNTNGKCYQHK